MSDINENPQLSDPKDFSSSLSRDIRTPLNTIIGTADLARRHLQNPEKADEYLDLLIRTSRQLLEKIEHALHIESAGEALLHDSSALHLRKLIDETEMGLLQKLFLKGQEFSVSYDPIYHENLIGDKDNLLRIFSGLLALISDRAPAGSLIRLTAKERIQLDRDSSYFDFLFQAEDGDVTMTDTTLKQVAELMNGTISNETSSSVRFSIRLLIQTPKNMKRLNGQDHTVQGMRILAAEDNPLNRDILKELLQTEDILIDMAEDGLEAIKLFINHPKSYYDAILLDIRMPVMNGYEAADCIRRCTENGGDTIPIIAVTSDSLPEDIEESMRHGMNGHMSKPIDFKKLKETLSFWKNNV